MKLGLTLSSSAHALVLFWGLAVVSAPEALTVEDVEALPVDIVPIEELTKEVQGDKEAEVTETPAPKPTEKEVSKPEAENVGETKDDTKSVEAPKEAPVPVKKQAEAPEPEPKPIAKPEPEPQVEELIEEAAKATELAALPDPATPVQEELPADEPELQEEGEQFAALPDSVPVPTVRPKPPKPNTAKAPDRKKEDKKASEKTGGNKAKKKTVDEIDNLINKADPAAGGAKASKKVASLGTSKGTAGKLSQGEMDALVSKIVSCSTGLSGRVISDDLRIKVHIKLTPSGDISSVPVIDPTGGTLDERKRYSRDILRFIKRCAPYNFLPKDKYETWAEIVPTFHPAKMFQ